MTDPHSLGDIDPEELRRHLHDTADWIAEYLRDIEDQAVLPRIKPGEFARELGATAPEEAESLDTILADFKRLVPAATTHWNHPSFHAYFSNTGSGPGIIAEALTAALNSNAMLWRTGPAATEMEAVTTDWLRQMLGLADHFDGHIEDTASVSTLVALAAAREQASDGQVRAKGLRGLPPMFLYCSEEAHSSVEKAAIILGLGQEGVHRIPVDEEFRLRADVLDDTIAKDKAAGAIPVAVVATAGTTSTTSIDPIPAIAEICTRERVWLHVDAAYGGAMAVDPDMRWVLDGCDRADSIVVNPHKWLFVPMDCSVLYCREAQRIRAAFSLVPPYLMTPEDAVARNLMDYGPALGRRFRALKLWMVLRAYGRRGIADRVRHHVELAAGFARRVDEAPQWERMAPTPMSTVLFRHRPAGVSDPEALEVHNQALLDAVNATGRVFLSHTMVRGAFALRLAIGNIRTQERHIETAWELLRQAAADAPSG